MNPEKTSFSRVTSADVSSGGELVSQESSPSVPNKEKECPEYSDAKPPIPSGASKATQMPTCSQAMQTISPKISRSKKSMLRDPIKRTISPPRTLRLSEIQKHGLVEQTFTPRRRTRREHNGQETVRNCVIRAIRRAQRIFCYCCYNYDEDDVSYQEYYSDVMHSKTVGIVSGAMSTVLILALIGVFWGWSSWSKKFDEPSKLDLYDKFATYCRNAAFVIGPCLAFCLVMTFHMTSRKFDIAYTPGQKMHFNVNEEDLEKGLIRYRNRLLRNQHKVPSPQTSSNDFLDGCEQHRDGQQTSLVDEIPFDVILTSDEISSLVFSDSEVDETSKQEQPFTSSKVQTNIPRFVKSRSLPIHKRSSVQSLEQANVSRPFRSLSVQTQYVLKHDQLKRKLQNVPMGEIERKIYTNLGYFQKSATTTRQDRFATTEEASGQFGQQEKSKFQKVKTHKYPKYATLPVSTHLSVAREEGWSSSSGSLEVPRYEINNTESEGATVIASYDAKSMEEIQKSDSSSDVACYATNSSNESMQKSESSYDASKNNENNSDESALQPMSKFDGSVLDANNSESCVRKFNSNINDDVLTISRECLMDFTSAEKTENFDYSESDLLIDLDLESNFRARPPKSIYRKIFDTVNFFNM